MEDFLIAQIDKAIEQRKNFVLETPLSHPDYWKYIDRFESKGYQIQLNYEKEMVKGWTSINSNEGI